MQQRNVSGFLQLVEGIFAGSAVALLIVGLKPWGTILQVSVEDSLGSIDQEERCEPHGSARSVPQAPDDRREFGKPFLTKFLQLVVYSWFEAL